ncbi:MAG TPA: histidine phosphatase family protein [Acidimicrobiales bacterium]|jgi:phosphohistidine phosphatase|nr:histidine phosphatase family protein [Acidimicrobiales bacterium]
MLRYLWVLRHGKAARSAPAGGGDKERPLTARGRRDATALGHRLGAGVGVFGLDDVPLPQVVLCSSAVRTRQTADLVLEAMGGNLPLESLHSLYGANPDTVLGYLRELDDNFASAMLVGHNPTVYELAFELLARSWDGDGQEAGDRLILRNHGFSTCSLAVIGLPAGSWSDLGEAGGGSLAGVFSPPY